jgi:hypothetical protein
VTDRKFRKKRKIFEFRKKIRNEDGDPKVERLDVDLNDYAQHTTHNTQHTTDNRQ